MKKTAILAIAVLICGALISCEPDSISENADTSEMATGGSDITISIPLPPTKN